MERVLITARDLEEDRNLRIPQGAILTPLARDLLRRRGVDPDRLASTSTYTQRMVVANWKSHKTLGEARAFAAELRELVSRSRVLAVVCPPSTALATLHEALGGLCQLGAQDVSADDEGAHTGDLAPRHLTDAGCTFAIVGHSERRAAGETCSLVRRKVRCALRGGLRPILCVGETREERAAGRAEAVVGEQLRAALGGLAPELLTRCVVAYEPRWAIGTGLTPTAPEIAAMLAHCRAVLVQQGGEAARRVSVLYGGSVSATNAAELLHLPGCDGGLVGGASLSARSFAGLLAVG
jgi:triosephosphate isomerase (TIM)